MSSAILGIDMLGLAKIVGGMQLHVTVNFLGYLRESKLESAKRIVSEYRHEEFDISAKGAGMFESRGSGVVFIAIQDGAAEISIIHSQLEELFRKDGIIVEDKHFTPHITLARFKGLNRNGVEALRGVVNGLENHAFGRFRCTGLALKKSVLSNSGPAYSTLASSTFTF